MASAFLEIFLFMWCLTSIHVLRLSSVNGITLNEEKFKERVIAEGGDIRAVQRLINHLQHEYENDPHRMFVVDKESLKSQMEMRM